MTHDLLLSDSARSHEYFQKSAIENLFQQHQNRTFDHSYRLWSLLIFEVWMQKWLAQ